MDCPKRSAVDGLPEDSLLEILSRAPVRSVYRSKCVAKGWRDLIEDPLNAKKMPQTLQGFFCIDKKIYGGVPDDGSGGAHVGFTSLLARSSSLGIDRRLSFLTKLPGIEVLTLADSCNGLLLFEHGPKSGPSDRLGYIVCNPTTKHWVLVPRSPYIEFYSSNYLQYPSRGETGYTYLVFDPVVSSHFHIVRFWFEFKQVVVFEEDEELEWEEVTEEVISVHVYSSDTGTWSHILSGWEKKLGQLERWRHQGFIPPGSVGVPFLVACCIS